MITKSPTRRELLRRGLQLPIAGAALSFLAACGDKGGVCFDAAAAPAADKTMRDQFHYVEKSADASKVCGGCAFFTGDVAACGTCSVFSGPANGGGHCDSWAARSS